MLLRYRIIVLLWGSVFNVFGEFNEFLILPKISVNLVEKLK